jgi:hypothetical protein
MPGLQPDAELIVDGVLMVTGNQAQNQGAAGEPQGVERFGAAAGALGHGGAAMTGLVLQQIVRVDQRLGVPAGGQTMSMLPGYPSQLGLDLRPVHHRGGQNDPLADSIGDEAIGGSRPTSSRRSHQFPQFADAGDAMAARAVPQPEADVAFHRRIRN